MVKRTTWPALLLAEGGFGVWLSTLGKPGIRTFRNGEGEKSAAMATTYCGGGAAPTSALRDRFMNGTGGVRGALFLALVKTSAQAKKRSCCRDCPNYRDADDTSSSGAGRRETHCIRKRGDLNPANRPFQG